MSLSDLRYFNNMVAKQGTLGIGDYIMMALGGIGVYARENPVFWYVNPVTGLDTNSGTSPAAPFKTIQFAVDSAGTATDGRGDVIFLQSGNGTDYDDDTVGASLADAYVHINKPDLSIIGLGPPNSVIIKPDAAATAGVIVLGASADRVRIANLTIDTTTAQSGAIVSVSGAHYPTIENVIFNLVGAAGPLGVGIDFDAAAVNYPVIRNCNFYCGTLIKAAIRMKCGTTGGLIEDCFFVNTETAGTPTEDGINVKAGKFLRIKNCTIHGGATADHLFADGIDIDAGVVNTSIDGCYIGGCTAAVTDGGTATLGKIDLHGYTSMTAA